MTPDQRGLMTDAEVARVLDAAKAAKEVATMTALALIKTGGDAEAAIALLTRLEGIAEPQTVEELDVVSISEQAIREALVLRGEG